MPSPSPRRPLRSKAGTASFKREIYVMVIGFYVALIMPAAAVVIWLLSFTGDVNAKLGDHHATLDASGYRLQAIETTLRTLDGRVDSMATNIATMQSDIRHILDTVRNDAQ